MPNSLPERLPNGNLRVLMRAEGPGGIIGDGVAEIGPEHPAYETWDRNLRDRERDQDGPLERP
ncbi:hypothetical protein GCM10023176_14130 [Micromonospora coerulea]|uniref:Uncharacterized protein n=1 Tax=Micromonospora coerulea TaxID=47856 RepID=A0ABP8SCG9_9ACTN